MRRTLFLVGLLLEVVLVFLIFLPYAMIVANGQTVTLKTLPLDPRSVFRGDYVVLSYEIVREYDGPPFPSAAGHQIPVYVLLEKKGDFYERTGYTFEMPTHIDDESQACIRGIANAYEEWTAENQTRRIVSVNLPDIEQYFVEEGLGKELEQARNARRLHVDIATTKSCKAVIKGVRGGEEVIPTVEPIEDERPVPLEPR